MPLLLLVTGIFLVALSGSPALAVEPLAQIAQSQTEEPEVEPAQEESDDNAQDEATEDTEETETTEEVAEELPPSPEIQRDFNSLPFPVKRMRELLLEAAKSGDVEKLRVLIGSGDDVTQLSLGGIEGDPIEFLKESSGDEAGHEILAILIEVLETGFVHMDIGTDQELYIWPYFFGVALDDLKPEERVELYRIVTHGDYLDMESFGAYIYYRVGITPEGRWRFFVAGD